MALIGNVIASAFAGNPALINYDIFVATFSMLSLFYLIAAAWNESFIGHPIIPVVVDLLNAIFFFTAAIAMAAELGAHSCSNDVRTTFALLFSPRLYYPLSTTQQLLTVVSRPTPPVTT
jgi:hypothetical protein